MDETQLTPDLLADLRARLERRVNRSGGEDACHPWTGATNQGYGRLKVRRGGQHYIPTHRLALILDGRLPNPGQVARHRCHTPLCCNPRHLTWGTQAQNVEDRQRAGRQARGEGNGRARLTHRDVAAIRSAPRGHGSMSALAREYGVHITTIRDILAHKIWKDV